MRRDFGQAVYWVIDRNGKKEEDSPNFITVTGHMNDDDLQSGGDEDLLKVETILGENKHRTIHSGNSDFGFALSCNIYLNFVSWPRFGSAELGGNILRILSVDVKGYIIGSHLTVRQYLVNEKPGYRCHKRSRCKGYFISSCVAGEYNFTP